MAMATMVYVQSYMSFSTSEAWLEGVGGMEPEVFDFGGPERDSGSVGGKGLIPETNLTFVWVSCRRILCVIPKFPCQSPTAENAAEAGKLAAQEQEVGLRRGQP